VANVNQDFNLKFLSLTYSTVVQLNVRTKAALLSSEQEFLRPETEKEINLRKCRWGIKGTIIMPHSQNFSRKINKVVHSPN
jgi:hypothetical protein